MNTLESTQDPLADIFGWLIELARQKRAAAVALLDADDAEFNKPFSEACELDALLQGVPSPILEAEEARAQ